MSSADDEPPPGEDAPVTPRTPASEPDPEAPRPVTDAELRA